MIHIALFLVTGLQGLRLDLHGELVKYIMMYMMQDRQIMQDQFLLQCHMQYSMLQSPM